VPDGGANQYSPSTMNALVLIVCVVVCGVARAQPASVPASGAAADVAARPASSASDVEALADAAQKRYERGEKQDLERLTAWSTAAAAAGTLAVLVFNYLLIRRAKADSERQAEDTRKALAISKEAADAAKKSADVALMSTRAWLSMEVRVNGRLYFDRDMGAELPVVIVVRNSGGAPAMGVCVDTYVEVSEEAGAFEKFMEQALLVHGLPVLSPRIPSSEQRSHATHFEFGRILFPQQATEQALSLRLTARDLKNRVDELGRFRPDLYVLVSYTYTLAERRSVTAGVFVIRRRSREDDAFRLGVLTEQGFIAIEPHSNWGGFAA
jgi:hypothetical protein